tara:strand:+ start:74 stop:886 length:813 start_codon:yes stop_codon:yes gene_type:complete
MVLIGIGDAGVGVVNSFSDSHTKITITTSDFPASCKKEEDYEAKCPSFRSRLKFKEKECWVALCGGSKCSSATLRILETIKHKKINIIYICPDPSLSGPQILRRHKVVYSILQEYTRSGLIQSMCLISNREVLDFIGDQPITNIYNNINETIANTIETIEWFKTESPVMGSTHKPKAISRIYTVSIGNFKKNEEKMLFSLDNITETGYIYSISKQQLENNKDIISLIRDRVTADENNKIISSFAIYSSQHKQSFFYSLKLTHYIQQLEKN